MRFARLFVLTFSLALCGCAGYRLGPTDGSQAGAKSVQITPFLNHSPEPGLADEVTSALRKAVQRDGTLRLATQGDGDWIVNGVITTYQRRELSLQSNDVRTVSDYQVNLTAQITVRERASGRILFDQAVTGTTLLRVGADFTSTERQATPLLAEDLARQITGLLVDGKW
jgi:hypothetical protein